MADTVRAEIIEEGSPRQKFLGLRPVAVLAAEHLPPFWHQHYMPLHFVRGANYRYKMNVGTSKAYNRIKKASGSRALVKTGRLEKDIRQAIRAKARSLRETAKGKYHGPAVIRIQGIMAGPRYAFLLRDTKTGGRVALHDDIVSLLDTETSALANKYRDEMVARLNLIRPKHRQTLTR